jgi:hypothetical protein
MTILKKIETVLPSGVTEETITARIDGLGIVESSIELTMDRETGDGLVCGRFASLNEEPVGHIQGLHMALLEGNSSKVIELLS